MRDILEIRNSFALCADVKSILQHGDPTIVANPKITIIVPCYNHPFYLKKALYSCVNQDYKEEYEIVVVDNDDSSDYTENRKVVEKLDSPKILYYHNEKNIGGIGNWNRGVELARAPYITYCHDDDMLLPNCLTLLMENRHGDKAVFGLRNHIDKNDRVTFETKLHPKFFSILKPRRVREYTLMHHFLLPLGFCVGSLYSRNKFIESGGFGTEFPPINDAAFAGRYTKYAGAVQLLVPTHNYRFAENDTFNVYRELAAAAKRIRESDKPFLPWPDWFLDCIIRANFNVSHYEIIRNFEPNATDVVMPSWIDRIICKLSGLVLRWSMYRIL